MNGSSDDNHYKAEIERLQKIIGKQAIQIEILKNGGAIWNKREAVEMLKETGYAIKDVCDALGISRSSYYSAGWVYLVIVLDWYTKKITGWNLSLRSRATEWKEALDMAINGEFPGGVRGSGLKLISDNGSQPTATSFMRDMATLGIEQIFTSYDNPKGNADTERVMRTIKEEIIWLNEFGSFEEAKEKIGKWIEEDYNRLYMHSKLNYMSPEEFEARYDGERIKKVA